MTPSSQSDYSGLYAIVGIVFLVLLIVIIRAIFKYGLKAIGFILAFFLPFDFWGD